MSTEQHLDIVQLAHLVVVDGNESHLTQTLTLHTIMHNITETIELRALGQLFFGLFDGGGHSKAEATAVVYFYLYHFFSISKYISSKSCAATNEVLCPDSTVCSAKESCALMAGLL